MGNRLWKSHCASVEISFNNPLSPSRAEFAFATYMDGQELDGIQVFLDESVKASCEGLMVKMLDGTESGYEPSKRSRNWLKVSFFLSTISPLPTWSADIMNEMCRSRKIT